MSHKLLQRESVIVQTRLKQLKYHQMCLLRI